MASTNQQGVVGELAVAHLDAAYNLARWLLGNEADATDAVQEAFVRNCCFSRLEVRRRDLRLVAIDQVAVDHGEDAAQRLLPHTGVDDVEYRAAAAQESAKLHHQLRRLPAEFREVLVLREIEEMPYREIADALGIPIGTVMSRLARGREKLAQALATNGDRHGART